MHLPSYRNAKATTRLLASTIKTHLAINDHNLPHICKNINSFLQILIIIHQRKRKIAFSLLILFQPHHNARFSNHQKSMSSRQRLQPNLIFAITITTHSLSRDKLRSPNMDMEIDPLPIFVSLNSGIDIIANQNLHIEIYFHAHNPSYP